MIIFIIVTVLMIAMITVSIILCIRSCSYIEDVICVFSTVLAVVCTACFVVIAPTIMIRQTDSYSNEAKRVEIETQIEELNISYQVLENNVSADTTTHRLDVIEYNNKIKQYKSDIALHKVYMENPWINWFVSKVYKEYTGNEVAYYIL